MCSLEDFPRYIKSPEFKLTKGDLATYPFPELLLCILRGDYLTPLIFLKDNDEFRCIEGKHRCRLISLCQQLNIEVPKFPVIKVEHIETRDTLRYPDNYPLWINYMKTHSLREKAKLTKTAIESMTKWD